LRLKHVPENNTLKILIGFWNTMEKRCETGVRRVCVQAVLALSLTPQQQQQQQQLGLGLLREKMPGMASPGGRPCSNPAAAAAVGSVLG